MVKYSWDDIFNFDDNAPVQKFNAMLEGMETVFKGFAESVEKSNERVSKSLEEYRTEATKMLSVIDKQNVAYDNNSTEMEQAAKATADLFHQTKALRDMYDSQTKELAELRTQMEKVNETKKEAKKLTEGEAGSFNDLKKQINEATAALQKMGTATDETVKAEQIKKIQDLSAQYNKLGNVINEARKYTVTAAKSYDDLNRQLVMARRELKSMEGSFDSTNPRVKELGTFINEADRKLKDFDKTIGLSQRNVGGYTAIVESLKTEISNVQLPGGAGGSVGGALSKISPATLGVGAAITGAGALGKAFVDESVRIKKALETVNSLTGLTGRELEKFTAKASATAKTFDKEFNETIRAGNVIVQSFGVDGTEAFESINQLMLRGVDINGDFLEQISEYSTFVAQAGGSTQDLVDILLASEQAGVFSDKGLDTIKEATLRIREMTPATRDAIKGLGLNVKEIEAGLRDGSKSVLDVIKTITKRMGELPPISKEVGTAIADIFAGPGEDAGQFLFKLGEINSLQGDWTESLTGSYKAQYELLKATEEYETTLISTAGEFQAFSINMDTFWTKTKTIGLQVLAELSKAFTTLDERIGEFQKTIGATKDINLLQKELADLQKQMEDGPKWWYYLTDAITTFGNSAAATNKVAERFSELGQKAAIVQKRIGELLTENTEITEDNTKAQTEALDAVKKRQEAEFKLEKYRLERAIEEQERIYKNQANAEKERTDATVEAEKLRNQLVALERKHDLKNEELTEADRKLIMEKSNDQLADVKKQGVDERTQILIDEKLFQAQVFENIASDERKSFDDRATALIQASEKRQQILDEELTNNLISFTEYATQMKALQDQLSNDLANLSTQQFQRQQDDIATIVTDSLTDLEEEYSKGKMSLSEYYSSRDQIQRNGNRIALENQLDFLQETADALRKGGADTTEIDRQIAETRLAIASDANDELIRREEELQNSLAALRQTAIDTGLSMIQSGFEREQMELDARAEKLQERHDIELQMAGDNGAKVMELEANFAKEQARMDREQAALKRKQAIFERTAAVFQIGVNTAMAISASTAAFPLTGGMPFAAINAAIGALQIAAVLAKPIPAYAEGTDFHAGGLALFGEAGPEAVRHPDGTVTYHNKPTIADLERGSVVYNAKDTQRMFDANGMMAAAANQYVTDNDRIGGIAEAFSLNMDSVVDALESMEHTIKHKKEVHLHIDKYGVRKLVGDQKSWSEFVNQNYF